MLTKLRNNVTRYIERIAIVLSKMGFSPNAITILGLIISFICIFGAYLQNSLIVLIALSISSLMDILDGALARTIGKITRFGSVLDSFVDRVEESIYLLSLIILGFPGIMIIITLAISFLVSYLRALGEKYNLKVEGIGILERGERILLLIVSITGIIINYKLISIIALLILIVLGFITILQRIFYIYKNI